MDAASVYLSSNIPLQVFPSPVYPVLHEHVYETALFWQTELTSQEWEPVVHSSKSKRENHIVKRLNTLYSYSVLKVKNFFPLYIYSFVTNCREKITYGKNVTRRKDLTKFSLSSCSLSHLIYNSKLI